MSNVTHPKHYNSGRFEVVEIIEDQCPDFHLGNAIKYICRAGKKDPGKTKEDLEKAIWYIQRKIELLKESPRRPNDMNPPSISATSASISNPPEPPLATAGSAPPHWQGRGEKTYLTKGELANLFPSEEDL